MEAHKLAAHCQGRETVDLIVRGQRHPMDLRLAGDDGPPALEVLRLIGEARTLATFDAVSVLRWLSPRSPSDTVPVCLPVGLV